MRAAILIAAIIAMTLVTVWAAGVPVKSNGGLTDTNPNNPPLPPNEASQTDELESLIRVLTVRVGLLELQAKAPEWATRTECEQAVIARSAKNADGTPQLFFGQHLLDMGYSVSIGPNIVLRSRIVRFRPSFLCAGIIRDQELDRLALTIRDEVMRENVERLLKDYLDR